MFHLSYGSIEVRLLFAYGHTRILNTIQTRYNKKKKKGKHTQLEHASLAQKLHLCAKVLNCKGGSHDERIAATNSSN
jgi:hypothetical protein